MVCFLYLSNQNPRKIICCGKKWCKCHLPGTRYNLIFMCGNVRIVYALISIYSNHNIPAQSNTIYGELGWVGFLVLIVCFLYKINLNPTKNYLLWGNKSIPNATSNLIFLWVGLALGWGVPRFHSNSYMFSNPT